MAAQKKLGPKSADLPFAKQPKLDLGAMGENYLHLPNSGYSYSPSCVCVCVGNSEV